MPDDEILRRYRRLIVNDVPDDEFIQIRARITPAPEFDLRGAAIRLLLILSQRTIQPLGFENVQKRDIETIGAVIPPTGPQGSGTVILALPKYVVSQREGLTQLVLTATSGAEYGYTNELWIEDIRLPREMMNWFIGPRYGTAGIRDLLNVHDRPLIGYVVKTRTSVSLPAVLESCREALAGGVDLLVDDILSTDPDGPLHFAARVPAIGELVSRHNRDQENKTASRAGYLANVGSSAWQAEEYVKLASGAGAMGCIVDCFTMGFGNVKQLIDRSAQASSARPLVFVATNMGSGIMGRNPDDERQAMEVTDRRYLRTGFSEALTAKLARLAGADAVHTGTAGSECFEVAEYAHTHRSLRTSSERIKASMPVAEGDMQLQYMSDNVLEMGTDVIIETASGIANHPDGVRAGARAFRLLAGCLNDSLDREDIDDVLNLLRHHHAEVMDPLLMGWKEERDSRIRAGWSPESSIRALSSADPTPELAELLSRRLKRRSQS